MNDSGEKVSHPTAARVAGFLLAYAAIFLGLGLVLGMAPPALRLLVAGTIVTAASLALTAAFTKSEGLAMADVGTAWSRGSMGRFVLGFAGGSLMVLLLIVLSRAAMGPVKFTRVAAISPAGIAIMVLTYVALAAGEELGFRGYPFRRLHARYGAVVAQVVIAIAFAVYHMLQGWPPVNALVGTTAGSVLFGVATLRSGGLAFPIGIHAAWNFGSWMLGTKNEAGYWRMEFDRQPSFVAGAAVYLAVMLLAISVIAFAMPARMKQAPEPAPG